jgi:hypothetical protein
MGSLRRVIAVGRSVHLAAGGTLYVTAIEVWEEGTIVHAAEQLPEFLPPGEPISSDTLLWMLSDDVGTIYKPRGGGSSGSQAQRRSTYEWRTPVPPHAATLHVVGPGMSKDEPMAIPLT